MFFKLSEDFYVNETDSHGKVFSLVLYISHFLHMYVYKEVLQKSGAIYFLKSVLFLLLQLKRSFFSLASANFQGPCTFEFVYNYWSCHINRKYRINKEPSLSSCFYRRKLQRKPTNAYCKYQVTHTYHNQLWCANFQHGNFETQEVVQ